MSVLACDRNACDNIMCDRSILDGTCYICNSCWKELLAYKESWGSSVTAADVRPLIESFMRSRPGEHSPDVNVEEEFKRLTRGLV